MTKADAISLLETMREDVNNTMQIYANAFIKNMDIKMRTLYEEKECVRDYLDQCIAELIIQGDSELNKMEEEYENRA